MTATITDKQFKTMVLIQDGIEYPIFKIEFEYESDGGAIVKINGVVETRKIKEIKYAEVPVVRERLEIHV